MFYIEGPEIARELALEMVGDFRAFAAKEATLFGSPNWDEFERTARAEFSQIKGDMESEVDGYCGVGREVRPKIDALHGKLPGFAFISGSDSPEVHSCKNRSQVDKIIAEYTRDFDTAISSSSIKISERVAEKQDAKARADAIVSNDVATLQSLIDQLNSVSTFIFAQPLFGHSLQTLQISNNDYYNLLKIAGTYYNTVTAGLPDGINLDLLRNLQSPIEVYKTMIARLAQFRTIVFAFVALLTDLLLVLLVSSGRRSFGGRRRPLVIDPGDKTLPKTDVAYLWTPIRDDGA